MMGGWATGTSVPDVLEVDMVGRLKVVGLAVALSATPAIPVFAHHSFGAVFDASQVVTLKGTVTRVERVNPHGWIYIDVKQPDGTVKNWVIETGTPQELARKGLLKETLPIGIEVVVQGYRAKDGSPMANGNSIKFPDGRELSISSNAIDAAKSGTPSGGAQAPY
jgi:hypothetical protein